MSRPAYPARSGSSVPASCSPPRPGPPLRPPAATRPVPTPPAHRIGRREAAGRAPPPAAPPSAPGALGGAGDELELALLIVHREQIAQHGGGETALGADGEIVGGDVVRRLVD